MGKEVEIGKLENKVRNEVMLVQYIQMLKIFTVENGKTKVHVLKNWKGQKYGKLPE